MKRLISIGLIVLAATVVAFAQDTAKKKKQSAGGGDEQALRKIEEDWAAALVKRDIAFIESIMAPDWTVTTHDGKVVPRTDANKDLKDGVVTFTSFKVDDLKIRVFGDAAVVHGTSTEKSTEKGKDMSGRYRFTDVFVKRDGKWQCVSTHVSKIGS